MGMKNIVHLKTEKEMGNLFEMKTVKACSEP